MPITVTDLIKPTMKEYKITPNNNNDYPYKSLLLFVILSLISDKSALRKIDLDVSNYKSDTLKKQIIQCLNKITDIDTIFTDIDNSSILESLSINNDAFLTRRTFPILYQLLFSSFYNYLGLSSLTIESFDKRTKTLIGFNNYINFDFKLDENQRARNFLPLKDSDAEIKLLKINYSNKFITGQHDYPDFIIVNEWDNKDNIDERLYNLASDCDILNNDTYNRNRITLFGNQEYKLISCISTNYTKSSDKTPIKDKHNVIYLLDETFNINTYTNREFNLEKIKPGYIYPAKTTENIKCDKIYRLLQDPRYPNYEYSFLDNKCDIDLSKNYTDGALNFSLKQGNRILIYYKTSKITEPAKGPPVAPKGPPAAQKGPPKVASPPKYEINFNPNIDDNFGIDASIDKDLNNYLKVIRFKEYINDYKRKINNYYNISTNHLAKKIIDDISDDIYENYNKQLKKNTDELLKRKGIV
jgi:hypothetical protein